MPAQEPKLRGLLAEIAGMFGTSAEDSYRMVDADSLRRLTQKQLQDVAKRLAVTGYSRLNKETLVARIWAEMQLLMSGQGAHVGATANDDDGDDHGTPAQGQDAAQTLATQPFTAATPPTSDDGDTMTATGLMETPQSGETNGVSEGHHLPEGASGGEVLPGRDIPVKHRFDVARNSPVPAVRPAEAPNQIPWGYAKNRVTAMPVDPERLFVYWEVLEESIVKARAQLADAGASAWLNIRLYDTTGRIFDGSNAHTTRDQGVDRNSRQWFFDVGRPSSEVIVEIGMLASNGAFAKIARSGRVEFPRREPVTWSEPEWMTVRVSTGHVERASARAQMKSTGSTGPGSQVPPGMEGLPSWQHMQSQLQAIEWQDVARFAQGAPEQRVEWEEVRAGGTIAFHRRILWESPTMITSWESGPLTYPVEVPLPVRESFIGKTRVFRIADKTHVVYGPWQVIIRGLGAHHSRTVLSRWEVFRSWQTTSEREVQDYVVMGGVGQDVGGASEKLLRGSSEFFYAGGSELRLLGSSEMYFIGASEIRFGGASELLFSAASENLMAGASERRLAGGSEIRLSMGAANAYPSPPSETQNPAGTSSAASAVSAATLPSPLISPPPSQS